MHRASWVQSVRRLGCFVAAGCLVVSVSPAQSIFTVAGGGTDDGRPATVASLSFPWGAVLDGSGNLYISDSRNDRIRMVSAANGIITTVAGSGTEGFSGDGGAATSASLFLPWGVAVDGSGNLFIADRASSRIRAMLACVNVGAPELVSPSDGSHGVSTSPRLAWNEVDGAFRYDVLLDTVNLPKQVVIADIETTTFSPANLGPLTQYYWQVVAKGDPFCTPASSSASEVRSFTTTSTCSPPGEFGGDPVSRETSNGRP